MIAPVLGRPANAQPLASSLAASTKLARLLFVCSPGDRHQIAACKATGCETLVAPFEPGRGDWARKLELARHNSGEEFMLFGADDLRFHDGWDDAVLAAYAEWDVGVVGTNDLANPQVKRGLHSTHPVVCRGYAEMHGTADDKTVMLHQGYWHQYVDNELVETARARNCWLFCADARVEHAHPFWGTAAKDDTYERGQLEHHADRRLYTRRRQMWTR